MEDGRELTECIRIGDAAIAFSQREREERKGLSSKISPLAHSGQIVFRDV